MRPQLISWAVAFGVLLAAFGVTVAVLNSTLYSASGFIASYLDALERHDTGTALALPGVLGAEGAAADLLVPDALDAPVGERAFREEAASDGVHTVTVEYGLAGDERESVFRVQRTGAIFGLFSTWAFESSPLASVAVTVLHDDRFRVNGIELVTPASEDASAHYLVFTPGLYTFDHQSPYLAADPVPVVVSEPGSVTAVQVNVQANEAFVGEVRAQIVEYLDGCATQQVLLPTGCPFGRTVENRVHSTPEWSISQYPSIEIVPSPTLGTWLVPTASATAHLGVEVQSLFDGTISTIDEDVPFSVSYTVTLLPNDGIRIEILD